MNEENRYWQTMQDLLMNANIVIDRPKGQRHPRHPDLIYPLDYGYLEGTTSGDGEGIDIWIGSSGSRKLTGILCTFDTFKLDVEVKLLTGCSQDDVQTIIQFTGSFMRFIFIPHHNRIL